MARYLLVLDMDLLALDEQLDLELINYFVARQQREPCEGGAVPGRRCGRGDCRHGTPPWRQVGKFPVAPTPDHDVSSAAEHRMNLAVRHLKAIHCRASGVISDEELVKAVPLGEPRARL